MSDSVILRWLASMAAHVERAWQSSGARSLLRRAVSKRSRVEVIDTVGYALFTASVTHAMLLWLAPAYARPFYGPAGAAVMAGVAIAVLAFKHRLAAAWASRDAA